MKMAFMSANKGHLKEVKFLIELGFDVHLKASSGMDILNAASYKLAHNHMLNREISTLEVCKFLIEHGSNPFNVSEVFRSSAFHELCCIDEGDVSYILISCFFFEGCNLDVRNENGETALMLASRYYREKTIEDLLRHGANPTLKNDEGDTAAVICMKTNFSFDEDSRRQSANKILDYDKIFRSKYAPEVYKN